MPPKTVVLEIDKPHFTIRLYENMLKMDMKGSVKNEVEEALENKPILRQTLGNILSIFVPLHIRVCDIDSVHTDESGKVKIILPRHRDIIIPLQPKEAKRLVNELNELIPKEKRKEALRVMREQSLQKAAEEKLDLGRTGATYPMHDTSSEVMTPDLDEKLDKAHEVEEQKKED